MKNKQKIEEFMNWFILLSMFGYFSDPEINLLITKIVLPIALLFLCYKLLK